MKKIVVLGGEGALGRCFSRNLERDGVVSFGRADLDIMNPEMLRDLIPYGATVINTAGYTNVDAAESDEASAFLINAQGAANVARAVMEKSGRLIQISTDYVFDGESKSPYSEEATPAPQTVYGKSKLEGERYVREILPNSSLIVRTAWLYGYPGKSFPATILKAAQERESVDVVTDQVGQPTWTRDVVRMIELLLDGDVRNGVIHATSSGQTSWFTFTQALFGHAGLDVGAINPVASEDFPRAAARPTFSALSHERWSRLGLPKPRPWEEALAEAWDQELHRVLEDDAP